MGNRGHRGEDPEKRRREDALRLGPVQGVVVPPHEDDDEHHQRRPGGDVEPLVRADAPQDRGDAAAHRDQNRDEQEEPEQSGLGKDLDVGCCEPRPNSRPSRNEAGLTLPPNRFWSAATTVGELISTGARCQPTPNRGFSLKTSRPASATTRGPSLCSSRTPRTLVGSLVAAPSPPRGRRRASKSTESERRDRGSARRRDVRSRSGRRRYRARRRPQRSNRAIGSSEGPRSPSRT